jgi:hypothetical protein
LLGENRRSERMIYYGRMEDTVPENHLLRLIDTDTVSGLEVSEQDKN